MAARDCSMAASASQLLLLAGLKGVCSMLSRLVRLGNRCGVAMQGLACTVLQADRACKVCLLRSAVQDAMRTTVPIAFAAIPA